MKLDEYKKKVEETLQRPLSVEQPQELYKEISVIESLSYLAVKLASLAEQKCSRLTQELHEKSVSMMNYKGTVGEKKAQFEAENAELLAKIDMADAEVRYWKDIARIISQKVSLAQSVMSSVSAQIKAGMYVS